MKKFQWLIEERYVPLLRQTFKTEQIGEGPGWIVKSLVEQGAVKLIEESPKEEAPRRSRKPSADDLNP